MEQADHQLPQEKPEAPITTIREMELEDLAPVFRLGEKVFTAKKSPNLYRTWDEFELVELFGSDGEFCLVAEEEDQIVGFVLGTLIAKRRSSWRYGWVLWLGVEPGKSHHGVGRRLVNRLTDIFIQEGARMLLVDTETSNRNAVRFFRRLGFGNEVKHLYLSRNLTKDPDYLRHKAEHSGNEK